MRNPLSSPRTKEMATGKSIMLRSVPKEEDLPDWWPAPLSASGNSAVSNANEEQRREANRVARGLFLLFLCVHLI